MGWTEVRVLVPQGWEELVAETLQVGPVTAAAFGRSSLAGEAPPEGHELVRCYLAADDDTPALRATLVRALAELGARAGVEELGGLAPEFRELPPEDYARSWRKGFRAFRLGRLCLVPPWTDYAPRPGEVVLRIEPGPSFGSGRHATTRACLRALERRLEGGERVLDAGCGSGVLSVAAARLGAATALGFDLDRHSAPCARALAADNGVGAACTFRTGGFEVLGPDDAGFDVALANIYADVVEAHAAALAARLRPGGWFAFSGCHADHADGVRATIARVGLALERERVAGRWHTFEGRRPDEGSTDEE